MSSVAPVVGCVILRRVVGETELLLGRYSPNHAKEYLRNLITGPGGKRNPRWEGWEDPMAAGLREAEEETGAKPGDLSPIASEDFFARVYGHGYDNGVLVTAILLKALPSFQPRTIEEDKVGDWRWCSVKRLPSPLLMSPLSAMCNARFGLRGF